jgi:1,4-dihydroxy-2-naphthoyl-CoA hydrolase
MSEVHVEQAGLGGLLGFTYEQTDAEGARGSFVVDERHLQPFGIVHGGCYAALAEALASYATFAAHGGEKLVAGLSNHTSFLRPVRAGDTVTAVGVPKHRGSTTWVWEVDMANGEGKPCALCRVTIAVRDPR